MRNDQCDVPGCPMPALTRGLCLPHVWEARCAGMRPEVDARMTPEVLARFVAHLDALGADRCENTAPSCPLATIPHPSEYMHAP